MLSELDNFYLSQEEPNKSCYLALRDIILACDSRITPEWKYKIPFFYLDGKMFCYFWKDKKTQIPYIGFSKGEHMNHPLLIKGDRKKMKVYYVDPDEDIAISSLQAILEEAIALY